MTYTIQTLNYPSIDAAQVAFDRLNEWMRLYNVDAFVQVMAVDDIDGVVLVFGVGDDDFARYNHKLRDRDLAGGRPIDLDVDIVMAAEALHARNKEAHDFSTGALEMVEEYDGPQTLRADGTITDDEDEQ